MHILRGRHACSSCQIADQGPVGVAVCLSVSVRVCVCVCVVRLDAVNGRYEKHTLLATIAKEEDTIENLRMQLASQNGGIKSPDLHTPSAAVTPTRLTSAHVLTRVVTPVGSTAPDRVQTATPHMAGQRLKLERQIRREQAEMAGLQSALRTGAKQSLSAHSLGAALVADVRGTDGVGLMDGTEHYDTVIDTHGDVHYMGDQMVAVPGSQSNALELAGAVPNGLRVQ